MPAPNSREENNNAKRKSNAQRRRIVAFGENLRTWRLVNRLRAALIAERVRIARGTLSNIETGTATMRLNNVFAVLEALGLDDRAVAAVGPLNTERGRALLARGLPIRGR